MRKKGRKLCMIAPGMVRKNKLKKKQEKKAG